MQEDFSKQLKNLRNKSLLIKIAGVLSIFAVPMVIALLCDLISSVLTGSRSSDSFQTFDTIMAIGFLIGIAVCFCLFRVARGYGARAKYLTGNICQRVLEEVMTDVRYDPQSYFSSSEVAGTNLYSGFKYASGSDMVSGVYRAVPLRFSDLYLYHTQRDSDGHTQNVTDFKGVFLAITCDRQITGELTLKEGKGFPLFKGKRIETENTAFNKKFIITGSSQQDVFYILTPQFMETIVQADQYADAKTRMFFSGNTIYVGLASRRDLFEAKKAGTSDAVISSLRSDLKYVTGFVDLILSNPSLFDQTKR